MANKIIYDPPISQERFSGGMLVEFVATADSLLKNTYTYGLSKAVCCSSVKSTPLNWFYPVPENIDINRLTPWIDEISPIFPELKIKLVRSLASIVDPNNDKNILNYYQNDDQGKKVTIELKLSTESMNWYSCTNSRHYQSLRFHSLDFLLNLFLEFCIKNRMLLKGSEIQNVVADYVAKNINDIQASFKQPFNCKVIDSREEYNVTVCNIIDSKSATVENITEYLKNRFSNSTNIRTAENYLKSKLSSESIEDVGRLYIQALYSNKSYKVQAYLAHHLIRAGISKDFIEFVDQYFTIKKELPDEYFWNLIFLTQFGFKFYYYYWLTNCRVFRMITPEEFIKEAKNFLDTSSFTFMGKFNIPIGTVSHGHLKNMYIAGDFKNIRKSLGQTLRVKVKDPTKSTMINLRIADFYEVGSTDENYYYVRGDDFRMHKYLKTNFDLITA